MYTDRQHSDYAWLRAQLLWLDEVVRSQGNLHRLLVIKVYQLEEDLRSLRAHIEQRPPTAEVDLHSLD